jgi:hypothetical protein
MRLFCTPTLLALVVSCTGETADDGDKDGATGTDTGAGIDTDDTARGDTGDSAAPEAELVGISVIAAPLALTTRDTLAVSVTGEYDDGTQADLTSVASYASSDEAVLKFYAAGKGQPINAGAAHFTVTVESFSDGGDVTVTLAAAEAGDVVFNEVLADGSTDGDPNGDGNLDPVEDEFVEIANQSGVAVDLSGATLVDSDVDLARHTFAEGTILLAGEALVVFGGGNADAISGPHCVATVAANEDIGLQYGLALANEGDTMSLVAADGVTVLAAFAYGTMGAVEAVEDASMVLEPDVWGTEYTSHHYADGAVGDFSPCSLTDGTAFGGPDWAFTR